MSRFGGQSGCESRGNRCVYTGIHGEYSILWAILVAEQGHVTVRYTVGFINIELQHRVNLRTQFYLASVSKPFTALAILMLAEQQMLGLQDSLSTYFPSLPYAKNVTIEPLLTHTSGIPDSFLIGAYKPGLTNADVLSILSKQQELEFAPGEKFTYSNSSYVLLALIVESVSGMKFGDFLSERVFEPLGMEDTFVYEGGDRHPVKIALGYDNAGIIHDYDLLTTGSGGYSTVEDLILLDQALYSEELVGFALLEQAFSPARLGNGTATGYGYGWFITEVQDEMMVGHNGRLAGFNTVIWRHLNTRDTIIILSNRGGPELRHKLQVGIQEILDRSR
jgi:CubicO group peptidase (beta-lactamase class C family)